MLEAPDLLDHRGTTEQEILQPVVDRVDPVAQRRERQFIVVVLGHGRFPQSRQKLVRRARESKGFGAATAASSLKKTLTWQGLIPSYEVDRGARSRALVIVTA
jgi:hypothetical protein